MVRRWRRSLAGVAVFVAVAGGSTGAGASEEPERTTAEGVGSVEQSPDADPAVTYVPLPDLGFAHRRPDGGINLFRMPLSDLEGDFGAPSRVSSLPAYSGYRSDRSRVVAGDFGNITAGDDGTADHVIWHMGSDGGIRVYGVGGGSDTAPRLWHVLGRSTGWSWADSRPVAGDLNGDGWDDLAVVTPRGGFSRVFALLSDGTKLSAPRMWGEIYGNFAGAHHSVADGNGDLNEDVFFRNTAGRGGDYWTNMMGTRADGTGPGYSQTTIRQYKAQYGWSLASSRHLAGDVNGDGVADLVTVTRSGNGGIHIWVEVSFDDGGGRYWWDPPVRWQSLGGGWSFANSRQYLADTNGDYVEDLVSVHRSSNGGMLVWRHVSNGSTFTPPRQVANLPSSSGWSFSSSRESVANTWGALGP